MTTIARATKIAGRILRARVPLGVPVILGTAVWGIRRRRSRPLMWVRPSRSTAPYSSTPVTSLDREQVLADLVQHSVDGRITIAEHAERSGQALRASTCSELAAVTADLPIPESSTG